MVRLFVDPVIGELRVREVQRKDIAALHHGLRDKPYQANRTLSVLSKMFSPCLSALRIHPLGVACVCKMASGSSLHVVCVCNNRIGTV